MKILLIYPYFLEERVHVEEIRVLPQGIFFVAALCRQHGYDVEILTGTTSIAGRKRFGRH